MPAEVVPSPKSATKKDSVAKDLDFLFGGRAEEENEVEKENFRFSTCDKLEN
jgi:hypothetical protein